jgi:hypothetical protein
MSRVQRSSDVIERFCKTCEKIGRRAFIGRHAAFKLAGETSKLCRALTAITGPIRNSTTARCGLPIFLKVNHRLESRMQEICQSGSEGGAKHTFVLTPFSPQGFNPIGAS